jgi:hypothetical protein
MLCSLTDGAPATCVCSGRRAEAPISFGEKRIEHRSIAETRSGVRVRIYGEGLLGFAATLQKESAATHLSDT